MANESFRIPRGILQLSRSVSALRENSLVALAGFIRRPIFSRCIIESEFANVKVIHFKIIAIQLKVMQHDLTRLLL